MKPVVQPLRPTDPKSFNGWRLKGLIGEGGFSTIYLAEKNQRTVALKMIRKEYLHDSEAVLRFFTEIKNLELLNHPNIAKYIESNTSGFPSFAVEYVDGYDLEKFIIGQGPIKGEDWFRLARSLASTLIYCHLQGIIHKDVSPGNIVLGDTGPVFIDFGISYLEFDPKLTSKEKSIGTPPYMSPEHFGSDRPKAMDSFSLGGTLIYAGTGHYPFQGSTKGEWTESILFEKPDFSGLSEQQVSLLAPLMFKATSDRLPLEVFVSQLDEILGGGELNPKQKKLVKEARSNTEQKLVKIKANFQPEKPNSRMATRRIAAVAIFALLSVVLLISLFSRDQKPDNIANPPVTSTPIASPTPTPEKVVKQDERAFDAPASIVKPTSNSKNSETCGDLAVLDNVESKLIKACGEVINSGDLMGYYYLGFYYYEQNNTREAISWWQLGSNKGSAVSMYRLAGVFFENGEISQAKKWYVSCIDASKTDTGKSWCMNGLGKIYFLEKDFKQSRVWYQKSADLGDQEGLYRVGMNYATTKEWQKALDNYLKIKNPNVGTQSLIAEAYSQLGNQNLALVWYQKAADSGSADSLVNIGVIHYVRKDFTSAIQAWKRASDLGSGLASYKLGRLYVEMGKPEEAFKYDKIGAAQGETSSIFFYAFTLQENGDYKEAKLWYQKGVDKDDPMSMVQLGAILDVIDSDRAGACVLWRAAAALGNSKAKENVSKFCG